MTRRDRLQWAVAGLPVLLVVVMAWRLRWTDDDGFINFRILDQVFAGHGPVFNAGQRVEAYTSPLWLFLLGVLRALFGWGIDQGWLAVLLGIGCTAGGMVAAALGASRLRRRAGATGFLVPFGLVIVAALPPVWEYATSGLETGLAIGWTGLSFWALCRFATQDPRPARPPRWVLVVLGLGPLVRPELALHSVALLVAVVVLARPLPWRRLAALLGWALAVPVTYQLFRMGFFATMVPNTALAKAATSPRPGQGWFYLSNTLEPYLLVVPLLAAVVWFVASREARRDAPPQPSEDEAPRPRPVVVVSAAMLVAGGLQLAYVVLIGGDYMHARMLLVPIFTVCCPVALVEVRPAGAGADDGRARAARFVQLAAAAVVLVWGLATAGFLRAPDPTGYGAKAVADQRAFFVRLSGSANPVTLADWKKSYLYAEGSLARREQAHGHKVLLSVVPDAPYGPPPDRLPTQTRTSLFLSGIGVTGSRAGVDVPVIDIHGLSDPIASRLPLGPRTGLPGHERWLPLPWAEAEARVLPRVATPGTGQAVRALDCGQLGDLTSAISDPLTPGRFLSNVVSAPRLTWFEVPPDPAQAVRRFC